MKKIIKMAMKNKKLAATIIGQVIVDEGYIGTDTVTIRYNSEENARTIWNLANNWEWVNTFQKHKYIDNRKPNQIKTAWRFNLKRNGVKEIYSIIGSLPDKEKDAKIQIVIKNRRKIGSVIGKGISRKLIIKELKKSPCTIEDLVRKLNLCKGTINYHLRYISKTQDLRREKINGYGKQIYYF
jgi:uncharacterized protein YneF (UPF0154 family)